MGIFQSLQTWQDWIEGCEIIIGTDHKSLAGIKKSKLPRRMQRFVDILEHFDPTIIYRRGKSNHLADWLSRPPPEVTTFPISRYDPVRDNPSESSSRNLPDAERLTWIDLHFIAECLHHNITLPINLPESWVQQNFNAHNGSTYRVLYNKFLKIRHYGKLVTSLIKLHEDQAHCSFGTLIRESRQYLWHADVILAAQEAYKTCTRRQLVTQPIDIHSQDAFRPVQAPVLFTRWGMDNTGPVRHNNQSAYLCTTIDHCQELRIDVIGIQ